MEGKSGLFYEAVRVIREMRKATDGQFPKFAVMENVVGMFSSKTNGKSDFLEVLNELIQTKDPSLSIPLPPGGKWSTSGEIVGDGFSLGWRTFDAQFWGVAQRRRRCYIVVHFTGERAGKILFDESGLRGNPPQGGFPWESLAGNTAAGIGNAIAFEPGACSRLSGGVWDDRACTLRAHMGDNQLAVAVEHHPADSRIKINEDGIVQTLPERMGTGGGNVPLVCESKVVSVQGNMIGRADHNGPNGSGVADNISFALTGVDRHAVCYQDNVGSLCASDYKFPQQQQIEEGKAVVETSGSRYIVRRLTPTECALLQGFPPNWCEGLETPKPTRAEISFWTKVWETHRRINEPSSKPKSRDQIIKWLRDPYADASEYKMWGNGVALPNVVFVLGGIVKHG